MKPQSSLLAILILGAAGCTTPIITPPTTANVDCAAGQSVNAALASGARIINITGICDENVEVRVDGVSLNAAAPGAGIVPSGGGGAALAIEGASNTIVSGLLLDGAATSNHAISMRHSDAIFQDVTVTGGKAAGVYVAINSSANIQASKLSGNDTALTVINNSYVNVTAGTVVENTKFVGVISSRASSVTFGGGSSVDGVDSGVGVAVAASAHFLLREDSRITNVNGNAVEVDDASAFEMSDSAITGNTGRGVVMRGSSGGKYRNSTITGNAAGPLSISTHSRFRDLGGNTVGP